MGFRLDDPLGPGWEWPWRRALGLDFEGFDFHDHTEFPFRTKWMDDIARLDSDFVRGCHARARRDGIASNGMARQLQGAVSLRARFAWRVVCI